MRIGILAVTSGGWRLAQRLEERLATAELLEASGPVAERLGAAWGAFDGFVCVMAAGIVVRAVAPLLRDKREDPCVVVVDEAGRYAMSLLSGHLGGGNQLAREVAAILGAEPVITTASDVLNLTSLDLWARDAGLTCASERETMTRSCRLLVERGEISVFSEVEGIPLPPEYQRVEEPGPAQVIVSHHTGWPADRLHLCPKNLAVGIGCNRGVTSGEIEEAFFKILRHHRLALHSVAVLATIDLKRHEPGLVTFARGQRIPLLFFSKEELNQRVEEPSSPAVFAATGAFGVAEPAAILGAEHLACGRPRLLVRKQKWTNVTMAVALADSGWSAPGPADSNT